MENNKQTISDIIKSKNFKSFWHCYDFLILAGYSIMDSFSLSLKEFGEENIFKHVAFIYTVVNHKENNYVLEDSKYTIAIWMIEDSNIHLTGLYSFYRERLKNNKNGKLTFIEKTCNVFEKIELPLFLVEYLAKLSEENYGYDIFNLAEYYKLKERQKLHQLVSPTRGFIDEEEHRRMLLEMARDMNNNRREKW